MMRRWMQAWNIPTDDVEDIIQDAFMRVLVSVPNFEHQGTGTFRVWLKKISRNCWLQSVRQAAYRSKQVRIDFDLAGCLCESTMQMIDTQINDLIEQEALEHAIQRARQQCNDRTWEAYRLMAIEKLSGLQVAETLGVSVDLAYKSKDRFERQLKSQLLALEFSL
jgi:RNA polymerase sigma-70 factor (ECF subfamily)